MKLFYCVIHDENSVISILTPELDLRLLLCQQMSDIYERGSLHGALLEVMLAPDSDKGTRRRNCEITKYETFLASPPPWHKSRRQHQREGNGGLKQYPSIGSE